MKKKLFIVCLVITTISLTAYSFSSCENSTTENEEVSQNNLADSESELEGTSEERKKPDFFYEVSTRFIATITKEKLDQAKTLADLVPKGGTEGLDSFRDVKIGIVNDKSKFAKGSNGSLNSAQINLLSSTNYSTDFFIEAFCKYKNPDTGKTEDYCFVYYVTIIPEKEAEFIEGHDAFMYYLEENSKEAIKKIKRDKLKPGKVRFTVQQNGEITGVELESTSGYNSVDEKMIELITNSPKKWNPATNSKGEKIDQELVFSFGLIGC